MLLCFKSVVPTSKVRNKSKLLRYRKTMLFGGCIMLYFIFPLGIDCADESQISNFI